MQDRREHPRANTTLPLLFYYENNHDTIYSISSKNISAGGCYLIFNQKVHQGSILKLGLDLDTSEVGAETVTAIITRCDTIKGGIFGLGVKFNHLSPKMKEAITSLVKTNINIKPEPDDAHYLGNNQVWNVE